MQKYYHIGSGLIRWNLGARSPAFFEIPTVGMQLLNPAQYSKEYAKRDSLARITFVENRYFIDTRGIILQGESRPADSFFSDLNAFFRLVRYHSKQIEIKPYNSFGSYMVIPKMTKGKVSLPGYTVEMAMVSYFHLSAITEQHLAASRKKAMQGWEIPIYEETFLEAVKAQKENDFNKCILFCAIACEAALAHYYDRIYECEKERKKKNGKLRFVIIKKTGEYTDPIKKALFDRSDFRKLLHEIPLYLLGKSILLEHENIYLELLKLYSTRNKIVHWGAPVNVKPGEIIEISGGGAMKSLTLTDWVFTWVGIPSYKDMFESKLVSFSNEKKTSGVATN